MSRLLNYDYHVTANGCTFVFTVIDNTAVNHYMDGDVNVFQLSEGRGHNKHRYNLTWDADKEIKWAFEKDSRGVREPNGTIKD